MGLEPKSARGHNPALCIKLLTRLQRSERLELSTLCLEGTCSAIEPRTHAEPYGLRSVSEPTEGEKKTPGKESARKTQHYLGLRRREGHRLGGGSISASCMTGAVRRIITL